MPEATFHFPRGFLWGTATSSHQVEGNNTNNQWSRWEEDGHTQGKSGPACDWWGGRWREDFDRAVEAGQNAHRLSVEWSRIQPTPDSWDEEALDKYRQMLRGLKQRNMTAMVTLHHYTDPLWLTDAGGWENDEVVLWFEKFVRRTVEALKEYTSLWCTINEPNGYALNGYVGGTGTFPPGKQDLRLGFRVLANLARGHAAAYRAIHHIQPQARAGFAMNYRSFKPYHRFSPLDKWVTAMADTTVNKAFPSALTTGRMRTPFGSIQIPEAKDTQDYFGYNYYTRDYVTFDLRKPRTLFARNLFAADDDLSENKFIANVPDGMYEGFKWIVHTFPGLPILVTENGVETSDDGIRPRYIAQHIHQMWRAVNFNWPIRGYFHWSLVDNFEWDLGWSHRFGLWAVDIETQKRTKRPSADLYSEICKENGLSSEMVQKYCPEVFGKLFPV